MTPNLYPHKLAEKLDAILQKEKHTEHNMLCETDGSLPTHFLGITPGASLALRMYSLVVLAKRGKDKEPMVSYDPLLTVMLNGGKYFSSDLGRYFEKQRTAVLNEILAKHLGVFLFTNNYGVQRAKIRSRLWTLSLTYTDNILRARAIFGRVQIIPMLPYEIVGITTIVNWLADNIGARAINIAWFFHEVSHINPEKRNYSIEVVKGFSKLLSPLEVGELLRMESAIRENKPKINPISSVPLTTEALELQNDIYAKFCS
jgi:hypothetical protein